MQINRNVTPPRQRMADYFFRTAILWAMKSFASLSEVSARASRGRLRVCGAVGFAIFGGEGCGDFCGDGPTVGCSVGGDRGDIVSRVGCISFVNRGSSCIAQRQRGSTTSGDFELGL